MSGLIFGTPQANQIAAAARDAADYPRQHEIIDVFLCPYCGAAVEMEAETDSWEQNEETGAWQHASFGPAGGECPDCGRVFVEDMDGRVLLLTRPEQQEEPPAA